MSYFKILLIGMALLFTACNHKSISSHPGMATASSGSAMEPVEEATRDMDSEAIEAVPIMSDTTETPPSPSVEPVPTPPTHQEVQSGILTAADIDDNLNLTQFQKYVNNVLQSNQGNIFPFMHTKDRVKLTILGSNGKGMNRVKVKIGDFTSYTNSQGILYIFPSVDNIPTKTTIEIGSKSKAIDLSSKKEFTIDFAKDSTLPKTLDLMFVVDTTGSMGDEMRYLAKEFNAIVSSVTDKYPKVAMRFGLTLYRDKGDDYVVRAYDFTSDVDTMKTQLEKQSANGGGDYPEVMDEGIEKALKASWKAQDGVRMMFVVADAPPHDEKIKQMVPIIEKAREKGIHIYPLGASGVAEKAEYIMRHLALFTQGRYLWLTDDSGVGNSHEEPKVNCYQVTRLDQLISRVIQSELLGERVEAEKDSIIRSVGSYQNGICQPEFDGIP